MKMWENRGGYVCLSLTIALLQLGCSADVGGANEESSANESEALSVAPVVRVESAAEADRMTAWVAKKRVDPKSVRRTLWTKQGRRVECVDLLAQPAVKARGLSAIEAPPTVQPEDAASLAKGATTRAQPERLLAANAVDAAGADCDAGTVPVAEVTVDDLKRFKNLEDFFRKEPSHLTGLAPEKESLLAPQSVVPPAHNGPSSLHQYAHARRSVTNWGALSTLNVWKAATQLTNEFSLSQIWVVGGSGDGLQTLEVGWQVYRDLYGDANPHLFIYSTQDNYETTGCYNNTCGDFVQTSSTVFPGQGLSPFSTPGTGNQFQTAVRWVKDGDSGSWWLWVEGGYVGYYPRALYNTSGVADHAAKIDYGGEIIDKESGGNHTTTDMGSGKFASGGFGTSAYQGSLRYFYKVDAAGVVRFKEATGLTTSVTDANCYDISYTSGVEGAGSTIYFGGPGYHSVNCQ